MARLKAAARKQQLLDVAVGVFARLGYERATTAQIAQAAGVTEPILYRHFDGKQALFAAIVRNVSSATIEHLRQVTDGESDPLRQLRILCDAIPEHVRRRSEEYHVLHGALATSDDARVKAVMQEHYQALHAFFRNVIKAGQRSGAFRKEIPARSAAWHIVMAGVGYAMLSLNVGLIERATIRETIDELLRGLTR